AGEPGDEDLAREPIIDKDVHRVEVQNLERGIRFMDCVANRLSHRTWVPGGANFEIHRYGREEEVQRHVEATIQGTPQIMVANIASDAYDLERNASSLRVLNSKGTADGILVPKIKVRHGLVDDGHLGSFSKVLRSDVATHQDGNSQYGEITGTDCVVVGRVIVIGRRLKA